MDIAYQLESGMKAFDLVDHDLLPPESHHLRLRKHTRFTEVKQLVSSVRVKGRAEFGEQRLVHLLSCCLLACVASWHFSGFCASPIFLCVTCLCSLAHHCAAVVPCTRLSGGTRIS